MYIPAIRLSAYVFLFMSACACFECTDMHSQLRKPWNLSILCACVHFRICMLMHVCVHAICMRFECIHGHICTPFQAYSCTHMHARVHEHVCMFVKSVRVRIHTHRYEIHLHALTHSHSYSEHVCKQSVPAYYFHIHIRYKHVYASAVPAYYFHIHIWYKHVYASAWDHREMIFFITLKKTKCAIFDDLHGIINRHPAWHTPPCTDCYAVKFTCLSWMRAFIYTRTRGTHTEADIWLASCACMHIYIYIYIYIYSHIRIHAYIIPMHVYTYTYSGGLSSLHACMYTHSYRCLCRRFELCCMENALECGMYIDV
jgi:hypothetical protein